MSTELQNRIDKIQQVAKNRVNAELQKQITEKEKREQLYNQIKKLAPRIKELVALANTCVNNGIHLTSYLEHSINHKPNYFFTDDLYHNTGFCEDKSLISHVGIDNGGCFGEYHLMVDTNGEITVTKGKEVRKRIIANNENLSIKTLKRFVDEFPEFETKFLNWIDNLN
jgi:uncharacterized protein (DUF2344 family)